MLVITGSLSVPIRSREYPMPSLGACRRCRSSARAGTIVAEQFDSVVEVNPEKGAATVRRDVELVPGRPLTIQVRDPDGKPLPGAQVYAQSARTLPYAGWSQRPLPEQFPVYGLDPGKGRTILVVHPEKNLAAHCEIKGDDKDSLTLTLQPAGTLVGQFVDDDGRPQKNTTIDVRFTLDKTRGLLHVGRYQTDAEGKFRIGGIIPGLSYEASFVPRQDQPYAYMVFTDVSAKSGESKDLGKVKAKSSMNEKVGPIRGCEDQLS